MTAPEILSVDGNRQGAFREETRRPSRHMCTQPASSGAVVATAVRAFDVQVPHCVTTHTCDAKSEKNLLSTMANACRFCRSERYIDRSGAWRAAWRKQTLSPRAACGPGVTGVVVQNPCNNFPPENKCCVLRSTIDWYLAFEARYLARNGCWVFYPRFHTFSSNMTAARRPPPLAQTTPGF